MVLRFHAIAFLLFQSQLTNNESSIELLIITGLSGAGKTRAADVLEDLDYYCVDNLPVALMTRFAELCMDTRGRYEKVALVTDIRDREGFGELLNILFNSLIILGL